MWSALSQCKHKMEKVCWYELTISGFLLLMFAWQWWGGVRADLGIMVLLHVDPFTNLLECPGRLGLARLLRCDPLGHVPVALSGRADAHKLLVRTVAAVATITAGACIVDRLRREKIVTENDRAWMITCISVGDWVRFSVCLCVWICTWSSSLWICSPISWMSESMIFPPWKSGTAKTSSFTGPLKTHRHLCHLVCWNWNIFQHITTDASNL